MFVVLGTNFISVISFHDFDIGRHINDISVYFSSESRILLAFFIPFLFLSEFILT